MLAVAVLAACGEERETGPPPSTETLPVAEPASQRLDGTWETDMMTIGIDFAAGSYTGETVGERFTRRLALVRERGDTVVFTTDGDTIVAQLRSDTAASLVKHGEHGAIPILLRRVR